MDEKKIEPTDMMVDAAANALSVDGNGHPLRVHADGVQYTYRILARSALLAALNAPDAAWLFEDDDAIRAEREQGWDDAAEYMESAYCFDAKDFRAANPYRPTAS